MGTTKIAEGVHWVGVLDPDLKVFDIIMPLEHGTTYNSYLIQGEKTAIVDSVKDGFYQEFLSNVKSLTDPAKIDYIVVQHTEPDHSGSMVHLLKDAPDATVVCSQAAYNFLRQIVNEDFDYRIVKDGDTLELGGKTLRFISAPLLHWPDSIFSYLVEDKVLFSCDAFGSHYCGESMFNDEVGEFYGDFEYYFTGIMGPFKPRVIDAIKKIKDLEIEVIAPSHGPILRKDPWKYVDIYTNWCSPPQKEGKDLLITFASAYGYTKAIADALKEGALSVPGTRVHIMEMGPESPAEVAKILSCADGILVGSPTIIGNIVEPVMEFLVHINPIIHKGLKASAFGSFGWSGEAVPMMLERMKSLKLNVVEPGLRINFKPSADDLEEAKEFGRRFAADL